MCIDMYIQIVRNDKNRRIYPMDNKTKPTPTKREKTWNIVGIVLCALLIPMLIVNVTMIITSLVHKDEVPGFFGYTPMIVLTDSMVPEIYGGDLVICTDIEAEDVEVGDIISFFDPMSTKGTVVTHRVIEIIDQDGKLYFKTKGDANNSEDYKAVPEDSLVGEYQVRIPKVGNVLMFMQTTLGLIVCIGVPLVALITYELLRRRKYEKSNESDIDKMRAELEALRAEKERQAAAAAETTFTPPDNTDEG